VFADAGLPVERHFADGVIELIMPLPGHDGGQLDHYLAAAAYHGLAMLFALGIVFVIYRLGQPDIVTWHDVFPGAAVATILWWIVDIAFGFYVRFVPYGTVYRGLAAVIGLLLWMYLTAMVIFMGAAYNAVTREGPFSDSRDLKFT
jgi:YihY family inner membrane protein